MFKFIICSMLILSCGGMGIIKSHSYTARLRELNDLRCMINILNTEISYRKEPLIHIFTRVSEDRNNISARLLDRCAEKMRTYSSFNECWSGAVMEVCSSSSLTGEDISILLDFKSQIGNSGIQGQNNLFRIMEERILQQINEAEQDKKTKGKMYSGLGFSVGIFITVLMI